MPHAPAFILPSLRGEPYEDVEIRIQAAVASIHAFNDPYPNITAVARGYEIAVSDFMEDCKDPNPGRNGLVL